jgi:Co/Zn/Cd efflux system component
MSEKMEHNASIDAVYDVVTRIEQQEKWLTRNLMALSISALLGLVVNAFVFMIFSHQKGALNNITIILIMVIFLIFMVISGLAIRKFILLKKFKQRLNHFGELEETIYDEVLRPHLD